MAKKRRVYEQGHLRKFLVIVDDLPEVETALLFAASRIQHSSGQIVMLYVIEPQDYQHWMGVRQVQLEEETNKAKAIFRDTHSNLKLTVNATTLATVAFEEVAGF